MIINAHVVIAVGMGLVLNKDANLLEENGGHISLTKVSSFENGFCEEKSYVIRNLKYQWNSLMN